MQVPRRRDPFADLCADHHCIAADDQHIFVAYRFALRRKIVKFHALPAGVLCDLLLRVQRIGHLCACVVGTDQIIQTVCRVLRRPVVGQAAQRLSVPVKPVNEAILIQRVSINARPHDAWVIPDLPHFCARCDIRLAIFRCKRRHCHQKQHDEAKCSRTDFFLQSIVPLFSDSAQRDCSSQNATACFTQPSASVPHAVPLAWGPFFTCRHW